MAGRKNAQTGWDRQADVVIVGFGGAGAAAAIEAAAAGCRVLILEKLAQPGGNTATSGGYMAIPDDLKKGVAYVRGMALGTVDDDEVIDAFVRSSMELPAWFRQLGGAMRRVPPPSRKLACLFPTLPGADSIKQPWKLQPGGHGPGLFKFFFDRVMQKKVEVLYEMPATRLVQDPATREIRGVVARAGEGEIRIKATKAVLLACGGYASNEEMMAQFNLPGVPIYSTGAPGNTGDGIRLVSEVGGRLWHMFCFEWFRPGIKPASDLFKSAIVANLKLAAPFIYVNRAGRRFQNEGKTMSHSHETLPVTHFSHDGPGYPNIPFYAVFDETQRKAGPIGGLKAKLTYAAVNKIYAWSTDNRAEIEKGWIVKADTPGELARKLGINATGLEATVAGYNAYCAMGADPGLGRRPECLVPLVAPPYYATELCLTILNTMGGAKRNGRAQILDHSNAPIPRLYAAGEFGSIFGMLYQGGMNLSEAFASGRVAGRNAAAERSWDQGDIPE